MAKCRVGMSTDPDARIRYWKNREGHTHSRILASRLTYDGALSREKSEAEARDCNYEGGGRRVQGRVWSVYHLWTQRQS